MTKLANKKQFDKMCVAIFALYLWLLVWVISLKWNKTITITDTYYIFGAMTWTEKLEFVKTSFKAVYQTTSWDLFWKDPLQEVLNVVVFAPFGLYISHFTKKNKIVWSVALSLLLSVTFECLQLVTNIGCFSAIDIIDNTLGGLVGWGVYALIYNETPKRLKTLSVASIVILAIAVPLAIFALVKTISMWDFYVAILTKTY